MDPALQGAAVIQGGQRRPPLQSKTRTVRNGTSRTPSPTHSVIARSEATRQSVLPSPKRRIPAPVTRSLARNDSAARWERRDTWVPPYGVRRSSRAGGGVRPYKAEQEPRKTGRRGRRPLRWGTRTVRSGTAGMACPTHSVIARSEATRQSVLPSPKRRIPAPVTRSLARNDSAARWERRDTWVPPYGVRRSSRADRGVRPYKAEQKPRETGRRGRRPLRWGKRTAQNGTAGTACPTNRRRAARTAKFRNLFFPLSASAGLRRLYSDDTGRPPVL